MKIENLVVLIADEGKTFRRIEDGQILGEMLALGVNDSVINYAEVDKQIEE